MTVSAVRTPRENRQNGGITDIFAHAVIVARTEPLGNRQTETVADSLTESYDQKLILPVAPTAASAVTPR